MIFRLYTKIQKENSVHFLNLVCTSFKCLDAVSTVLMASFAMFVDKT